MPGFTFDGRPILLAPGDTFASALHRHGVRVLSRSLKYHRPRGLYCVQGSCASCFVDVDGEPNVPACMRDARDGAVVRSQNRIGSARRDLLGAVDKVYARGFDPHDAFTRPRVVNEAFLHVVRAMSGLGRAPGPDVAARAARRHTCSVETLVVGGGAHGLLAAEEALADGPVLVVEEGGHLGGMASWDPAEKETRERAHALQDREGFEAWTRSVCFGLYGGTAAVVRGGALWEVEPRRTVIATGRHDAWPVFVNNDLPGVLSMRGAMRLLHGHDVLPGRLVVVHGAPLPNSAATALQDAGARLVAQGEVSEARGGTQVEKACVDGRWHACDTVVCNLPGTPRIELLQQAGCALTFRDGVLTAVTDGPSTTVPGIEARFTPAAEAMEAVA